MNYLSDIITYVRRIIKSPSNTIITDNLIIDYINRFYISDMDARVQLFDLKTKYQFQTTPGVDQYNMPLYDVQIQPGAQNIGLFPVYQGFLNPCYINGIQVPLYTQKQQFFNVWPNVTQNFGTVLQGNGTSGPYTIQFPALPGTQPANPPFNGLIRGHIDITGIINTGVNEDPPTVNDLLLTVPTTSVYSSVYITTIAADGSNVIVADSGQFLQSNQNYGLLMTPGKAPLGNAALPNGASLPTPYATNQNTINYLTGTITNLYFPVNIPSGTNINVQGLYFQSGLPRGILFYNNILTFRAPPDTQYLVELDAYLSPTAFLNTNSAIPFGYMAEYIARGAARKILSDTGDVEQFMFYEPLFKEQELLVWKRSQRIWTGTRTQTIYSQGVGMGQGMYNNLGTGN